LTADEGKIKAAGRKVAIEPIQMNNIPPYFLDLNNAKRNIRNQILEHSSGYLFEADAIQALDNGTRISPNTEYVQSPLHN
jgi:hypothetical protein